MKRFSYFLWFLCSCVLAAGCRSSQPAILTQWNDRVVEVHDTLLLVDTIYKHDSTIIRQMGETVYIDRTRYEYRYKYIDRWRDSIQVRHDSIDRPVIVEVEKELTLTERAKMHLGGVAFCLIAIGGCLWIIKWRFIDN